ncbi:MAG: nucleotidyl transferase AbiEii/AbiGii toxin family protein [Verrucomicrobiia bacterium]
MDDFARLPPTDRASVFGEAANQMGIAEQFVAKDFWVCWTLDKLFALPETGSHLIFKGGTSLSKVFGIIERFSEDIDVSLSREWLGFGGENDPERAPSGKKEQERLQALSDACAVKIREVLVRELERSFQAVLGVAGNAWRLEIDAADPQTVRFYYPGHPDSVSAGVVILPYVKIELGARSDDWPAETKPVTSYAAERVPNPFKRPACEVRVLSMERTFWEKATLLHAEYHRPKDSKLPRRLSRHLYDVARYVTTGAVEAALKRGDLCERVVEHKSIFFRSGWAHYEAAKPGGFRLVPPDWRQAEWRRDYEQMRDMIFGETPSFDSILQVLDGLEERINTTASTT